MDAEHVDQHEEQELTPRMEDIHPGMTAENKERALEEILRVLRGEE